MQAVVAIAPSGERLRTTFRHEDLVPTFVARVQKALPELTLHVVYMTDIQAKPPKGEQAPSRSQLWCPYCRAFRRFRSPLADWNPRCEVCRISDQDFYVMSANSLWGIETDADKWYAREEVDPELEEKREKRRQRAMRRRSVKAGHDPAQTAKQDKAERRKERKKKREALRLAASGGIPK